MKRIREFFESIAFAGLRPSSPAAGPKKQLKWLGPLQPRVEKFLAGGPAPNDPLYLSNRTFSDKVKSWSLIGIPCVVLAIGIAVTLYMLEPADPAAVTLPGPAISANIVPDVGRDAKLTPHSDLQVTEIRVENGRITGTVRNTSKRQISSARLVMDLTDSSGSQVGAVSTTVEGIPASGQREFEMYVKQRDASFALIREITLGK